MASSNPLNSGAFIPTSNIWDVSEIYSTEVTSPQFKELLVRLYQNLNNMANSINVRDAGYYVTQEFVNGQTFFQNPTLNSSSTTSPVFRQVYRKVINFGALPNAAGSKTVAHGIPINAAYSFTRIYACASDQTGLNFIPIPYASSNAADIIEIKVDATNVTITVASNKSAFTKVYVVLEYLKF